MTSVAVFVGQILVASTPPAQDLAAIAIRNLVPDQIDDGMVLARTEDARSYRVMFQLYSLAERKILSKPVLTKDDIPAGKKWILLLDPYTLEFPYYGLLRGKDFTFVELEPGGVVVTDGTHGCPAPAHPSR